ncbi:hypothetical protein [Dryocola sp. BD613]|uniref:hypothetical protein n=1 Tax=Dryocola sp. BD613 TaxID=3133272 RepID=UPI003F4FC176
MKQHPEAVATSYEEACELLRAGYVKSVRLAWNIGADEFFSLAEGWCDAGAKIKREDNFFIISIKGFPIPRLD